MYLNPPLLLLLLSQRAHQNSLENQPILLAMLTISGLQVGILLPWLLPQGFMFGVCPNGVQSLVKQGCTTLWTACVSHAINTQFMLSLLVEQCVYM